MYEFTIPGISGGPDQNAIRDAVLALDNDAKVDFNWPLQKVSVKSKVDLVEIREMLVTIGYKVEKIALRE
ncbi:MAG: copper chaperone [Pseudomonadota bacterium]|nr:copper chaperone [Pseudomonadota bacterium]